MKAQIIGKEHRFKPFEIIVKIESKEEAQYLWHNLLIGINDLATVVSKDALELCNFPNIEYGHELFDALNDYMKVNGLMK